MLEDVVPQNSSLALLGSKVPHALLEVLGHHLSVDNQGLLFMGFGSWHDQTPVAAGQSLLAVLRLFVVEEGVVAFGAGVLVREVGDLLAEGAVHMSVTIQYKVQSWVTQQIWQSHNKFMKYNQLTYHKASPFYKQDFLPDRAWYNRKPKEFPSEIPTGQQYFVEVGRRHYNQRFNHSEIEETGVLKSPEKYPYQNRIALDKDYMRSLDTTDIEGAGSGTRVNEAIRYKLRAQEELARKYNQSLDMREHKQHQYEQKRRELAMRNHQKLQERKTRKETQSLNNSRLQENPERNRAEEASKANNQQYYQQEPNNGRYVNLLPKPYYANLESQSKQPQYVSKYIQPQPKYPQNQPQNIQQSQGQNNQPRNTPNELPGTSREQQPPRTLNANDRSRNNQLYTNNYDSETERRRHEYLRTIEMDQMNREKLQDKREFRKHNPTNLSFNLAGQSIVSGRH